MRYRLVLPTNKESRVVKNNKPIHILGGCSRTYVPLMNKGGSINTGMDVTDANSEKKRINLEQKLSLSPGTLLPYNDYWNNFYIKVPSEGVSLDTSNPLHELYVIVLKADKKIAKSLKEYETNPTGFDFILRSEELEAEVNNTRRDIVKKAYVLYDKMSLNDKKDMLLLYNESLRAINTWTDIMIESALGDKMESDFNKFISLSNDNDRKIKANIIKYVQFGVLNRGTSKSTADQPLYFAGELLGNDLTEVVQYFMDTKKNGKVRAAIEDSYKEIIK